MTRIVLATCLAQPALQPDEVLLASALTTRGATVQSAAWNGDFAPFAAADLVCVRSTWDYHRHPQQFADWLDQLERTGVRTVNTASLMQWNRHKGYLLELQRAGAPLPPTRLAEATPDAIADAMHALDLDEAVVKPVFGAGADGLSIVRLHDAASLERAALLLEHDALVQPLIPEIRSAGETSLVFFEGDYSHSVVKRPRADSILVHAEHGGFIERGEPLAAVVAAARAIVQLLPEPPVYARIDMVLADAGPLLMEVEVIEPELFLRFADGSAERFAEALLVRLV